MEVDPAALVLWVDDSLLVIDKPAGLPTLPDGYNPQAPHVKSVLQPAFGPLWIVHRLDRQTSGVLALARSAEAHRNLNIQFEHRQVSKHYHALVAGSPDWETHSVNLPLRANGDRRHRTVIDIQRGKPAVTDLQVLERLDGLTLVEAEPHTGRTHQIRAHLAALGLPILGDELYGRDASLSALIERPALHARLLALAHPVSGQRMAFEALYPADFQGAYEQAKSSSASNQKI